MKDYMKFTHEIQAKGKPLSFCIDYPKHETSAGKEPQKQSSILSVIGLGGAFSVKYLLTHF